MRSKKSLEKSKDPKKTLKRIWGYLSKYKLKLLLVFIFIIISIIFNTMSSLLLTPIIDDYITPMIKDYNSIYFTGLIKELIRLICYALVYSGATYMQYRTMVNIAQNVVKDMRTDLYNKLILLPVRYFDTNKDGELMSRIINDIDNVSTCLNNSIDQIISACLNIVVTLVVMFTINVKLTIISVISVPILFIVSIFIMKLTNKHFEKQQETLGELNGFIEEYISGQKVIKAFNKEEDVINNFKLYNENLRKDGFKASAYGAVVMPIMSSINNISIAIIAVTSGIMAIKGKISIGSITSFNKFSRQFTNPINEIGQQVSVIEAGIAGAERVFEIIDEEREFEDSVNLPSIENVKGNITFKNVNFGYDDKLILKNINLDVKQGEMIAIVGPTGAGKTTIINLLTRFYDVTSGEILIDGVNIKDINHYSLRENLGIVLQDTVLFSDSTLNNIKYGKLDASFDEVVNASVLANSDNFINKLKDKYDTVLNEDITDISVGQRQLLNIARVILNDPKILILDEATSNVDTRTELKINEAMKKLLKGRTSFVIAHRLSTIRESDRIIVVNNGEIVEMGNHNELLKEKGMYYKMYTGMFNEE